MKYVVFVVGLITLVIFASGVPKLLNYQGKITDASGVALDGSYDIVFRIYDVETGGTPIWEESHSGVDAILVTNGLFDVQLGTITNLTIAFDDTYWIELEVGGEVLTPRERLVAVPYAFRAVIADSAINIGSGAIQTTARLTGDGTPGDPLDIAQQGAVAGQVLKWDGSAWAPANDIDTDTDNQDLTYAGTGVDIGITGGSGISLTGWDTNASDDLTTSTTFGGDVSGTYDNIQIGSNVIGDNEIDYSTVTLLDFTNDAGFITNPNDADADPTNEIQNIFNKISDGTNVYTVASTGDSIRFNGSGGASVSVNPTNGIITIDASSAGDDWGSQSAVVSAPISGNGLAGSPLTLDYNNGLTVSGGNLQVQAADGTIEVTPSGIREGYGAPKATGGSYKLYRNY
ncbi:hypothetical protein DRQ33_08520 [bacterium]|nr:MAG: hypothetical protein DRQ33_08520 [bacterium]